jgi:translation initiation factor 3 subunit M
MAAPTTASAPAASASSTRPRLVFVDGTFGELVQELADYLQIGESVAALVAKDKNEEALAAVVEASSALNAAPEKDFTGTYNLLIHLAINESKDPSQYLRTICQNLTKPVTSSPVNGVGLALNALQAVFNLVAPNNALRYNVFMAILRFLRTNGLYDNLQTTLPHLPSWLADWDVSEEAQRKLYLEIVAFAGEQGEAEYVPPCLLYYLHV